MEDMPGMTAEEVDILLQLLEEEARNLPVEIHHTRTPDVKEKLHARQKAVGRLLEKLRISGAAPHLALSLPLMGVFAV